MTIFVKNKYTLQIEEFKFICCIGKKGSTTNKKEEIKKLQKEYLRLETFTTERSHKKASYFIEMY